MASKHPKANTTNLTANPYNHLETEKKWQDKWTEMELYKTTEDPEKPKYYILDMFPYPSGEGLHVGHPKGYIATGIFSRFKKMKGFNVLHPMGWDAFGLPAENYAIKNKIHPRISVDKNIATFKEQLTHLGFNYDWNREINTTDPEFYKWTQWIFIQLFKKGLAYESNEPINWCPNCKTGLSNEDLENGRCERCDSEVEKKPMRQWMLKITDYADRMLEDLDKLPKWEKSIKDMQRNWIGKKTGINIEYQIKDSEEKVICFTTRPDTNFGATFIVIGPEHHLITKITNDEHKSAVEKYVDEAKKKSEIERIAEGKEKTGVFTGSYAINNLNGKLLPIWVADYVLGDVGTGAVVGVPAHDMRDFQFANKFGLEVIQVVKRTNLKTFRSYLMGAEGIADQDLTSIGIVIKETLDSGSRKIEIPKSSLENYKNLIKDKLLVGFWNEVVGEDVWFLFKSKLGEVKEYTLTQENTEEIAQRCTEYNQDSIEKTRNMWSYLASNDWYTELMIQEDDGVMVNSEFLNGLDVHKATQKIMDYLEEKGWGQRTSSYKLRDWVFSRQRYWGEPIPIIHCDQCGPVPVPEAELPVKLPEVDNYEPSGTGESPLVNIRKWVETTCPKCGGKGERETNTMPQWAGSSWYYLRFIDPHNDQSLVDPQKEKYWSPVDFYVGGAEHATRHLIYARFWHKFLYDIGAVSYDEPFTRLQHVGLILAEDGRKMSKRWGNVVNPDEIVEKFGADAMRVYEMFMGPFGQSSAWSTNGLVGCRRFLEKVWNLYTTKQLNVGAIASGRPTSGQAQDLPLQTGAIASGRPTDVRAQDPPLQTEAIASGRPTSGQAQDLPLQTEAIASGRPTNGRAQDLPLQTEAIASGHPTSGQAQDLPLQTGAIPSGRAQDPPLQTEAISTDRPTSVGAIPSGRPTNGRAQDLPLQTVRKLHQTIKKVGDDIQEFKFNTAIAAMMELVNVWKEEGESLSVEDAKKFLLILAPFAPHITEELWQQINSQPLSNKTMASKHKTSDEETITGSLNKISQINSIHLQQWPDYDKSLLVEESMSLPVQINGKLRSTIKIKTQLSKQKDKIKELALSDSKVNKWIGDKSIRKIVFIPGKLINFVT